MWGYLCLRLKQKLKYHYQHHYSSGWLPCCCRQRRTSQNRLQAAAVEVLNGAQDFIQERSNAFKERRDFVVKSLNNIKGITCLTPNGAFYVFPSCKGLLNKKTKLKTDTDFVQKLLEKSNVAVVQGSAFGLDGYFRISYATSMENLQKAMDRIKTFCESLS